MGARDLPWAIVMLHWKPGSRVNVNRFQGSFSSRIVQFEGTGGKNSSLYPQDRGRGVKRPEASSLKASWDPKEKDEDRRTSTQQESSSLINTPLEEGEISQF